MTFNTGFYSLPGQPPPELWVGLVNGHGSTNSCIVTFANLLKSAGKAPIWIQDPALGDSFRIQEEGVYFLQYSAYRAAGSLNMGISLNVPAGDGSLTGGIQSLANTPPASPLNLGYCVNANGVPEQYTTIEYLRVGDIVRAHDDSLSDSGTTNAKSWFKLIKIK